MQKSTLSDNFYNSTRLKHEKGLEPSKPSRWQRDALPIELLMHKKYYFNQLKLSYVAGFEPSFKLC